MSPTNRPRPVTSGRSSSRGTDRPKTREAGLSSATLLICRARRRNCDFRNYKSHSRRKPGPTLPVTGRWINGSRLSPGMRIYLDQRSVSFRSLAQFREGGAHGGDDVLVAGAAAQVRRQHVQQLGVTDLRLALQHTGGEHQESRGAEAALHAVMGDEGALQRMQVVAFGQALDRAARAALGLYREHQEGAHRLAVEQR